MLRMSQEDLAEAAGVGVRSIRRFELGEVEPREDTMMRIQAALEDRGIVFTNGDEPGVKFVESRVKPHLR